MNAPFRWFSQKVDDCLAMDSEAALGALRELITNAELDKAEGYGPPADDINSARRKWLALYDELYGRAA